MGVPSPALRLSLLSLRWFVFMEMDPEDLPPEAQEKAMRVAELPGRVVEACRTAVQTQQMGMLPAFVLTHSVALAVELCGEWVAESGSDATWSSLFELAQQAAAQYPMFYDGSLVARVCIALVG